MPSQNLFVFWLRAFFCRARVLRSIHLFRRRSSRCGGSATAARAAAASIDPEKIRAHVRFLSLDLLEGRGPGTRGAELAAEYIATQFALDGLSPPATTELTSSKCRSSRCTPLKTRRNSHSCRRAAQPVDLTYGSQIVLKDETGQPTADFDAPIVFVGYGIHAPEYNWDDYAGVDVERQNRSGHRQRAAFERRKVFQGQDDDLLRPLDLQVRRGRAPRGGGRAHHSSDRSGKLWLGRWCRTRRPSRRATWPAIR